MNLVYVRTVQQGIKHFDDTVFSMPTHANLVHDHLRMYTTEDHLNTIGSTCDHTNALCCYGLLEFQSVQSSYGMELGVTDRIHAS